MLKDPDSLVRKEGLLELIDLGEKIDLEFITKLFPEPKESRKGLLGYGLPPFGIKAADFIPILFKKSSPEDLLTQVNFFSVKGSEAYRVLATDHFQELEARIRFDLDSEFESLKSDSETRLREQYGNSAELMFNTYAPDLVDFVKDKFISAALDGLSLHGKKDDIKYARKYLSHTQFNMADDAAIKMISRFGDVSDVNKLIDTASKTYGEIQTTALEAAFNLSDNKDELLNTLMNHEDENVSNLAIMNLSLYDSTDRISIAKNLLNSDEDNQRIQGLAILLMNVNETDLENVLNEYLQQGTYYYNVVTWIDRCLYTSGRYKTHYRSILINKINQNL